MANEANSVDEVEKTEKKRFSNRKIVVIAVVGLVLLCCCISLAMGAYSLSTPEGKAESTARAINREATRTEKTAVAALNVTSETESTKTEVPTNTAVPTNTSNPTETPENNDNSEEFQSPTETSQPTDTPTVLNTPTPTSVLTDTPEPTNTIPSTNTPTSVPTDTPEPTNTIPPTDTPTSVPTDTPEPTEEIAVGLGVSRNEILEIYTSPEIDFSFEESSPVGGEPRTMGTSPNELAILELIGPSNNLTTTTMLIGVPNDDILVLAENVAYMMGLLTIVFPEWEEGPGWITENLETAANQGSASTTRDDKLVQLTMVEELGMLLLSIEPEN